MGNQKTWETHFQIRYNQALLYDLPKEGFDQPSWRKPPTKRGYSGKVTASTAKRIRTAVDVLLQKSPHRYIFNPVTNRRQKFQLSFTTLTISQSEEVPASEGHEALKMFLQHFKRPWRKKQLSEQIGTYIWKAELQSRGQLHYHLTANSFLHLAEIQRVWNGIQRRRGWLEEYHAKYGRWEPNSTDVHAVYKIKDVARYLTKYIAKQEFRPSAAAAEAGFPCLLEPVRLDAKVWGCSEDLKGAKPFSCVLDEATWENICNAHGNGAIKIREKERCRFLDVSGPEHLLSNSQSNLYQQWKN